MQSLGSYLRELRAARGVSLQELVRTTRVGRSYLEALECDALGELPAPVFTRGFVRAYCLALGEPPEEALSRYEDVAGQVPSESAPTVTVRPKAPGRRPVLVSLVLLLLLGVGLFVLTLGLQGGFERPTAPPRATASAPETRSPAAPVPLLGQSQPTVAEPSRSRLVARTSEPTWVRVQMDDGSVVQELLPAGATREWFSDKRFVLTVGNAGGIALELNGEPIPPLGDQGAVIHNLVLPPNPEETNQ